MQPSKGITKFSWIKYPIKILIYLKWLYVWISYILRYGLRIFNIVTKSYSHTSGYFTKLVRPSSDDNKVNILYQPVEAIEARGTMDSVKWRMRWKDSLQSFFSHHKKTCDNKWDNLVIWWCISLSFCRLVILIIIQIFLFSTVLFVYHYLCLFLIVTNRILFFLFLGKWVKLWL